LIISHRQVKPPPLFRPARRRPACAESPAEILTANIGCQSHLQSATKLPVRHWIEALDERLMQNEKLPEATHGFG